MNQTKVEKNNHIRVVLFLLVCGLLLQAPLFAQAKLPQSKQTALNLYVTAHEAFLKWQSDPAQIKIVDVRSPEEYSLIGHPPMAHNIPFMLYGEKWYAPPKEKGKRAMAPNPDFSAQIKKKFKTGDTLFLICRSGGRSARAVNVLAKAGFKKVYTVTDGFEGSVVKDSGSVFYGKRMLNGWKNSGAPWTYEVKPELAFLSVLDGNR
jgi:rhodanese-related sulfurtransferase